MSKKSGLVHCHEKKPLIKRHELTGISSYVGGSGSSRLILRIQNMLQQLGYQCDGESGIAGARTTTAIRLYQQNNNLEVTGLPTEHLLSHLMQ